MSRRLALPLALLLGLPPAAGAVSPAGPPAEPAPAAPRRAVPVDGPVDVDELLRLARISQALNARTYLLYSFRQTTREEVLDADGEVKRTETRVYRVIPSRLGTARHLLETDGEPPTPREVRKQQARNEKLAKRWEKIREKQRERAERRRREAQGRAREAAAAAPADDAPAKPAGPAGPAAGPAASAAPAPDAPPPDAPAPDTPSEATPAVDTPPPARPPTLAQRLGRARDVELLPDLPPVPECSVDDPLASLRPPPPGSQTTSVRPALSPSAEQARRERKTAGDYTIFELLSLTSYEYEGACSYDGRVVHVVSFSPDESFDPQNPVERVVTAMEGVLFIDADDVQVMRTEGRTVAPIKWGAGLVALREAHVIFEARKVNEEVWLPSVDHFEFDSRVLFDRDRQRFTHYYDDYRKLSVTSEESFEGVAGE